MRTYDKKKHMERVNIIFEQRCNKVDENLDEIYGISGVPTLRTLTRKSKFGFGKRKDLTMQKLLDLGKEKDLIGAYYTLSSINFIPEILEELGIIGEYVIEKPGVDKEMWYKYLNDKGYQKHIRNRDGANALKKSAKSPSKSKLQNRNQGKY